MQVLIYHQDAAQWRDVLAQRLPEAEFHLGADHGNPQVDYLVAWKPPASLFEEQRGLRGIVNLGAGVDALLNNPALPREIPIVKLRDAGMGELIGDYVRYGVLHFQRDFDRYQRQQRLATGPLFAATLAIVGLYTDERPPARLLRQAILRAGDAAWPVRRLIASHLMRSAS